LSAVFAVFRKPAGVETGFFLSFRLKSVFNLWPFEPTILPRM